VSLFYCMTTSLSHGVEGFGTIGLPETRLRALCLEAGFASLERLPVADPFNALYLGRRSPDMLRRLFGGDAEVRLVSSWWGSRPLGRELPPRRVCARPRPGNCDSRPVAGQPLRKENEMTDSNAGSGSAVVEPSAKADRAADAKGASSDLQSSRGNTVIADGVVTKVAGMAAREVAGVHALGGSASRALGAMTSKVGFGDERSQGVSVEVGEREAAIDLTLVVDYGESIPRVAAAVRENVIKRVEGITGLSVVEVNVEVDDLYFGDDANDEETRVS
ncbi:MAG: Asp23/Gls24 family envelope stress response protein, partial [Polyangiales bacterium]